MAKREWLGHRDLCPSAWQGICDCPCSDPDCPGIDTCKDRGCPVLAETEVGETEEGGTE